MKKILLLFVIVIISFGCKVNKAQVTQGKMETNWTILFDGSSFDHWRGYLSEEMYSEWTIEDRAMVFTPGKSGLKNIISREKYTSFILSIEWKISEAGNSGILWGVYEDAAFKEAHDSGPEIQVLDNEMHPDGKNPGGFHSAGALYDLRAPIKDVTKPVGEWNLCLIEVNHKTNTGKVTLNGTEIVNFPVHGADWDAMVANSKFKDWAGFGKYQTGHIGLQDHGDKVWYRDIKIQKLD